MHLLDIEGEGEHWRIRVGEVDVFAGRNYVVSVRKPQRPEPGLRALSAASASPELLKNGPGSCSMR